MNHSPVIVALDCADLAIVNTLANTLNPSLCRLKVGKELFTAAGMPVVDSLQQRGFEIFLDLKFHDIPNTVAAAVAVAARAGVWMVNVHASGGERMMAAAREAVDKTGSNALLTAVTVLTSMTQNELRATGVDRSLEQQVLSLASAAERQGLDGVVCSAREVVALRRQCNKDFLLITPGIRPNSAGADDQRRTCTPAEALQDGSDYLVIGRPITQAADPAAELKKLVSELAL